ncbi:alpha/beta fold hydrolase [Kaistella polysaccharea]|uniref:alpha/beta fold hydrolase n=1 Tax=Kaistella polysaccharea TaxID=2878534 RepID=UPI001CF3299B|nr:alpha/beta hydrolase [Kaistella polysaccharea]
MNAIQRNNVHVKGKGTQVMLFAHGFGCDQNMWRFVAPAFEEDYKVVLFDHVGAGNSDLSAYTTEKYSELEGYAADLVEICEEMELKDVIFVGHSVSSIIGMIASLQSPSLFKSLIMVSPSPSYINEGDYVGGFTREQITELLEALDNNHLGWSMTMAPVIMANPERGELAEELSNSFCRTNPDIAKDFARTTFFSDKRDLLPKVEIPTLILQCSDDVIAPEEVGIYMHEKIKDSQLVIMEATGHCPNLSAPEETIAAMKAFLS